tara:strand:+ start:454 stop:813 length:360 start_codon:yes stop_codon:yes gene_type:complete
MLKNKINWSILGGVAAAIGASLCCAGPLILLSIGISGAWISNLTAFEPYRPIFILVVIILFGLAGWQLFKPQFSGINDCEPGAACAVPDTRNRRQVLFVFALIISIGLVSSPYWLTLFA